MIFLIEEKNIKLKEKNIKLLNIITCCIVFEEDTVYAPCDGEIVMVANNDLYHIDYLRRHIEEMSKVINEDGIDLIGYTPLGCIDLVSASTGEMHKRYGFIYVDYQDDGTGNGDRYRKDSFYWYKKVIASNGEDLD